MISWSATDNFITILHDTNGRVDNRPSQYVASTSWKTCEFIDFQDSYNFVNKASFYGDLRIVHYSKTDESFYYSNLNIMSFHPFYFKFL